MTRLAQVVDIDRRFARSARIDADLNGTPPLVGYVMQASIAKALMTLAASQNENRQGAYTWTGPYGGGKSSAALLVANMVAGASDNRQIARDIAGDDLAGAYDRAFPVDRGPWSVVAVTGSRARLRDAIADAAAQSFNWGEEERRDALESDARLISRLIEEGMAGGSGTLLILDELGKLLEHEALEGGDVHLLQDIAERASRSEGRLVVIGILHQSFEQYAQRAARSARKEWAKVQGRFHDIAFLTGADETIVLLGRAIRSEECPPTAAERAVTVAKAVADRRPTEIDQLSVALADTWPLNPVTALLLGPVSRARFAQNERSVFGFLSSSEPAGFQDFLENVDVGSGSYDPPRLWDYLASNFGMSLTAGPDGHRFSLAFEAIDRAAAKGSDLHVALTKAAAVIEFFRNGSGLTVADDFLAQAVPATSERERQDAISDLLDWAVLIRQPRLKGYALFAGSDFDLEEAIGRMIAPVEGPQLEGIPQRAGFGFASAKRNYFETGALRSFEITLDMVGLGDTADAIAERLIARPEKGSGRLALILGDGSIKQDALDGLCRAAAKRLKKEERVVAVGGANESFALRSSVAELAAVERVYREHPQLEGDRIARREIAARQAQCVDLLHRALETALGNARWWLAPDPSAAVRGPLASVSSLLAEQGYPLSPILKSELLQRDKPSSSAMAALRDLCHAMVVSHDKADLGIQGFPAELGLYLTVLKPFGLHRKDEAGRFTFASPDQSKEGLSLEAAWSEFSAGGQLDAIFQRLAGPPYGMKAGVMPVLALAYMMANRSNVAVYIDDVYQAAIDDVVVDKLLQRPQDFRLRKVDRSVREMAFLSGLATLLEVEHEGSSLPVAQALFQRFEALPQYSARTKRVSEMTAKIRGVVMQATDPEALLFDDLPAALGSEPAAETFGQAIAECEASYPELLTELRTAIARSLGVDPVTFGGIGERASILRGLTNDFNFDAFVDRTAALEGEDGDMESLVSLLLHRPARNWSDRDREQGMTEISRFGRRFRELETLAAVRDRGSKTEAVALVVGLDPRMPPLLRSFALTEGEKIEASGLADLLLDTLRARPDNNRLQLAALARAVAAIAGDIESESEAA